MGFFKNFGRFIELMNNESFFNYIESTPTNFNIHEGMDFLTTVNRNRLWYRGDGYELDQFYRQLHGKGMARETFWGSDTDGTDKIDKYHYPIAKLMVDLLTSIVTTDLNKIELSDEVDGEIWEDIAKDNNIDKLVEDALKQALALGDGAFKVTFDTVLSTYPILEFYPADKVDFVYERGRLKEIVFKTCFTQNKRDYVLLETYGHGYINYCLTLNGKEVPLNSIEATSRLSDVVIKSGNMLAVPFIIYRSDKFEGRGESIFDSKIDAFEAIDMTVSLWKISIVLGTPRVFFDKSGIPFDKNKGAELVPSKYNRFYLKQHNMAQNDNSSIIDVIQPDIRDSAYYNSLTNDIEWAIQGIMSASTLAIDTKKITDPNASYERQMEKTTLYTRNKIIGALSNFLTDIVTISVSAYKEFYGQNAICSDVTVTFGEYSTPSFDAVVDTCMKLYQGGMSSLRTVLDELYGDTKTEEWKDEECKRIMDEKGYANIEEPMAGIDALFDVEEPETEE